MTEAFPAHLVDHVRHRRRWRDAGSLVARVHHVFHALEPDAELAARVQRRVVFLREAALFEQGHGERVTHGQHRSGRSRGSETQRTRLLPDANVDHHVARLGERRARASSQGDEGHSQALHRVEQAQQLLGLAAVGERYQHVVAHQAAEIAVQGFSRVKEEGGRACTGKSRRNLLPDQAGLAHPGHHHAARAGKQRLNRSRKTLVQAADQFGQRSGLDFEHLAGSLKSHKLRYVESRTAGETPALPGHDDSTPGRPRSWR